eukprot:2214165-Pleurochrysis_carterae.AAC.1
MPAQINITLAHSGHLLCIFQGRHAFIKVRLAFTVANRCENAKHKGYVRMPAHVQHVARAMRVLTLH